MSWEMDGQWFGTSEKPRCQNVDFAENPNTSEIFLEFTLIYPDTTAYHYTVKAQMDKGLGKYKGSYQCDNGGKGEVRFKKLLDDDGVYLLGSMWMEDGDQSQWWVELMPI